MLHNNPAIKVEIQPSINETEFCAYLKKCPRTLANWRKAGKMPPHFKVGQEIRYLRKDAEAFVMPPRRFRGKAKKNLMLKNPD